ncbi:hypothetical protein FB192DRAFT_1325716 [Mucor lusitanicus]|uniref:RING-type domain-containing protein n=1 Tax=Mucor circinelloides f. lusitanicus TaxID=29924 RepID=A0A8H4BHB6_MUCCL|nr:hypothetical protein FB192DRAFT_1325716 [Mucor lusitanicus]
MEQSSSNMAASTANDAADAPSPRTVRTNWLRFSWSQISGASKVILLISFSLSLIQIAATIAILALGSSSGISCSKPLQLYLIIFVVRVGLSLPLSIYQHLFTPRGQRRNSRRGNARRRRQRRRRQQADNRQDTSPTPATAETSETVLATDTTPHSQQDVGNNQHDEEDGEGQHQNQNRPASLISGWTDRVKSLLDLFAILWFIVGNYLIFSPSDCPATAAPYYYTILTWILLGYLILLIPLLACAAVIFCLPCVLVALRTFSINVTNVMVGGTKEEIAKIPVFKYKASSPNPTTDDTAQASDSANDANTNTFTTTTTAAAAKKPSFIRRIMKRPSYHNTPDQQKQHAHLDTITIPRAEDAVCSICLGEYETDELICKLWQVVHSIYPCAMLQLQCVLILQPVFL